MEVRELKKDEKDRQRNQPQENNQNSLIYQEKINKLSDELMRKRS